jgi:hypothetical protein
MVIRQFNEKNLHLLPSKTILEYDECGLTVWYPLVCLLCCLDNSLMVMLRLLLDDSRMKLLTKLLNLVLRADNFLPTDFRVWIKHE